jgi:rubrerythrin
MTDRKEEPGYFAIIPANVRYDKSLSANAKLLYGEITALCKKEGYCWASNSYFAELYDVQRSSISNWIKALSDAGYVRVEYIYAAGKPNIEKRKIYIAEPISANVSKALQKEDPKTEAAGGGQKIEQGGQLNEQGVVKFLDEGGQKNRKRIIQANNKAAADQLKEIEKPPEKAATAILDEKPPEEKTEPAILNDIDEEAKRLKSYFADLNPALCFDKEFYPEVLRFLSGNELDFDYVSWFYKLCRKKDIKNFAGYIFRSLLESRYVQIYKETVKPKMATILIVCPVCSLGHDANDSVCPKCSLEKSRIDDPNEVHLQKQLWAMDSEAREKYESELSLIFASKNISKMNQLTKELQSKYGLLNSEQPAVIGRQISRL